MKPHNTALDWAELRRILHYCPETGVFTYRVTRGRAVAGEVAGSLRPDGYVRIKYQGRNFFAQRLAWFYMTGKWPAEYVDHIDRNKSHNAWSNLREASHTENTWNAGVPRNNKSGVTGVRFRTHLGKWQALIRRNGTLQSLGHYEAFDEAVAARRGAESRLDGRFVVRSAA